MVETPERCGGGDAFCSACLAEEEAMVALAYAQSVQRVNDMRAMSTKLRYFLYCVRQGVEAPAGSAPLWGKKYVAAFEAEEEEDEFDEFYLEDE